MTARASTPRARAWALAACGAFAALSAAPTRATAQRMTLGEALERARVFAPDAVGARQRQRAAEADAQGAGRWPRSNPTVRLGGDYELDDDPSHPRSHTFSAGLEQSFDVAGVALAQGAAARAAVRAAGTEREAAELDALREAAELFFELDHATRALRVWEGLEALYERLAAGVERSAREGHAAPSEALLVRVEAGAVLAERAAAQAALARARAALAVRVGVDDPSALDAVTDDEPAPPPPEAPASELTARERPELRALREREVEAAERERAALRSLVPAPSVTVGLRSERFTVDPDEVFGADGRPSGVVRGVDHRSLMVYGDLSFALPVFDRAQAERARALADAQSAREGTTLALRRLRAERYAAREARDAAWLAWQRARASGAQLEALQQLTQRAYDAGHEGLVPTLVTLERVARGRLAALQLRAAYLRAGVALRRASGAAP